MEIGVLTSDGVMVLIHAPKLTSSIKDEELEQMIADIIENTPGNFNWQVLDSEPTGELYFRITTTDRRG